VAEEASTGKWKQNFYGRNSCFLELQMFNTHICSLMSIKKKFGWKDMVMT